MGCGCGGLGDPLRLLRAQHGSSSRLVIERIDASAGQVNALSTAHDDIRRAERSITNLPLRRAFLLRNVDIDQLCGLSETLDAWRRWADGLPVSLEASADALEIFEGTDLLDRSEIQALATPLADWASDHGFEPELRVPKAGRPPSSSSSL